LEIWPKEELGNPKPYRRTSQNVPSQEITRQELIKGAFLKKPKGIIPNLKRIRDILWKPLRALTLIPMYLQKGVPKNALEPRM